MNLGNVQLDTKVEIDTHSIIMLGLAILIAGGGLLVMKSFIN